MSNEVQRDIKGLVLKGLSLSLILFFLLPSALATSDCSASKAYPVYCSCDDGGSEKHTNAESFAKARKDVKSCCYYDSSTKNKIIDLGAYTQPESIVVDTEPLVQVIKPNEPEMRIIATTKAVDQYDPQPLLKRKFHRPKTLSFRFVYQLLEDYVQGTCPISKVIPTLLRKNTIPLHI